MAPASLPGRPVRGDLGGAGALDSGTRRRPARSRSQCRVARRPARLHSAHVRGVATIRCAVRPVRGDQPRHSAQLSERALAAAFAAALWPRDLSLLPRARRADSRAATCPHTRRGDERSLPRRCDRAVGAVAVGRMNAANLDCVTIDAYGTLVTLVDPVPALSAALAERNVEREHAVVAQGFRTEVAHYSQHSAEGHDDAGLARLQRDCARVFLEAVNAELDVDEFAPLYAGAIRFEIIPGVVRALERLRSLGLELAVVANWDLSLRRLLEDVGLTRYFKSVVHAARKPSPDGLLRALEELGVAATRALHIGDDEVDERAAAAAGMHFAPAPLPDAVAAIA